MWYSKPHHGGFAGRHCEIEPERNHSEDLRGVCTHDRWNQISSAEIICFKLRPRTEFRALNQFTLLNDGFLQESIYYKNKAFYLNQWVSEFELWL